MLAKKIQESHIGGLVLKTVAEFHPEPGKPVPADIESIRKIATVNELEEKVGGEPLYTYTHLALNRNDFPGNLIPDGPIYVFTHDEGFIYRKNSKNQNEQIEALNNTASQPLFYGNLSEIFDNIESIQAVNKNKPLSVLFFSNGSAAPLHKKIKGLGYKIGGAVSLEVRDFGAIKLYQYQKN